MPNIEQQFGMLELNDLYSMSREQLLAYAISKSDKKIRDEALERKKELDQTVAISKIQENMFGSLEDVERVLENSMSKVHAKIAENTK